MSNETTTDTVALKDIVKAGRVRVSMNVKHLAVEAGGQNVVQLDDGRFREIEKPVISFHREDNGESPWTRWYDLNDPDDKQAIDKLKDLLDKNPSMATNPMLRVRIASEYDAAEPWPGYDEQTPDEIRAYFKAMPAAHRPTCETMLSYELERVSDDGDSLTDKKKVAVIEQLHAEIASRQKRQSGAVSL